MNFHWYGFIVGCAVAVVLMGMEKLALTTAPKRRLPLTNWQLLELLVVTLISARVWHVATDWQLYTTTGTIAWWQWVAVWQGGLSILGAIVGLSVGIWWFIPHPQERWWFFDALALWLPIGQAIGRLANWVNQELYGLPTDLPWKIAIDVAHRLPGFEKISYFHPLFAYEAIGNLVIAAWLWWCYRSRPVVLGTGQLVLRYVWGYSWLRFFLDFFRLDRGELWINSFGTNQLVLGMVGSFLTGYFCYHWLKKFLSGKLTWAISILLGSVLVAVVISLGQFIAAQVFQSSALYTLFSSEPVSSTSFKTSVPAVPDHATIIINKNNTQQLTVEVVNTDASRQQGLSGRAKIGEDGMLFVFPYADRWVFWMKDMKFGLDLVWLHDSRIVAITADVPAPAVGVPDNQLQKYNPPVPANLVLEVPMGMVKRLGWQVGDEVTFLE